VSGARIAHRPEEYDQQQAPPDTAPRLIGDANLASYYPQDARQRGLTGDTALDLDIAADGTVTSAHVAGSTPPGVFDEAAERLSLRLRFQPATVAGRAVATTVLYRIHWTLNR
jgi:protein TonB